MKYTYFITDKIAGRCGPKAAPAKIQDFYDAGFRYFIALSPDTLRYFSDYKTFDKFKDISEFSFYLPDSVPPTPEDIVVYKYKIDFILKIIEQCRKNTNDKILIYCVQGNDRTGIVLANVLHVKHAGWPLEYVLIKVRQLNKNAISSKGYETLFHLVETHIRSTGEWGLECQF